MRRYALESLADFMEKIPWIKPPAQFPPARFNIAPPQPLAVVVHDGTYHVDFYNWGLIPPWAKDPVVGSGMINTRIETVAEKPAFEKAFIRRRCVIPASGYYEWKRSASKPGQILFVRMKHARPFAFAGIWESWHSSNGSEIRSCAILTCPADENRRSWNERMPVILSLNRFKDWLNPADCQPDDLFSMLEMDPAEEVTAYPVSRYIEDLRNDDHICIKPLPPENPELFSEMGND